MSFILDALRKSEHDRQRQAGPGLAEVAVAPPPPRTNAWAVAAVVLLIVNLVAVGIWLISRASKPEVTPTPQVASATTPDPNAPAPQTTVTATLPAPSPANPATAAPPMLRPALPATVPVSGGANPLAAEVSGEPVEPEPYPRSGGSAVPEGPPAVVQSPTRPGTVIYESLPEADPAVAQQPPAPPQAERSGTGGLPTADELAAKGGVAPLRLELHVYSNRPAERFVFINSHRYREGDRLSEGPQIEEITRDGVVLNQAGNRFVLTRD